MIALAALAACGGGDAPPADDCEQPQQMRVNALDAADAVVQRSGHFDSVAASMSRNARVWRSTQPDASAAFTVQAAQAGYYELFAWWPQALADAGPVRIEVEHADGRTALGADQRRQGGEWVSLGFHRFDPGQPGRVELRAAGGVALYADAVRWQYAGSERPPLQWRVNRLPIGLKGSPYDGRLVGGGGMPPYRYALSSGALPPGLSLDATSGHVSGRANAAGRFRLGITVHDAAGASQALPLDIFIDDTSASADQAQGVASELRRERRAEAGGASLDSLLASIAAMPEHGWQKVSLNSYSDVWTPADLRQWLGDSDTLPLKIIGAWSSFAWDSNRAKLVLYGGGHANYRGNDVYTWDAATRLWQRASLPSAMVRDGLGNWNAIDGVAHAPASAHTYDNAMYFPAIDRVVMLGGAADANGGHFLTQATATTSRNTGPYLFDPARADGNKVGGSTGSHVTRAAPHPEIVGGNMWSNRESWLHASAASTPPGEDFVNGCTGVATENGKDVAYVRTAYRLYRYTIHDLNNPAADSWQQVGRYYATGSAWQSTCAYDTARKLFVVAGSGAQASFVYWDLATGGRFDNDEVPFMPVDPSGEFAQLLASGAIDLRLCAMEYDPRRANHKLWCGDGRVWTLTPPATPGPTGWTITRANAQGASAPSEGPGVGILGKWKYIPNLDVFMGLADSVLGNVWIYKPAGWVHPSPVPNQPPQVSLTQPAAGAGYAQGSPVIVSANAADSDGAVTRVEYYANGAKIGESTAAPHGMVWSSAGAGIWSLVAVATDDDGARTDSAAVAIAVNPSPPANVPPSVSLSQPQAGATFTAGSPIAISASAADSDGSVVRVDFYAGPTKIGEDTQAPYAIAWNGASVGVHAITAVAIDDDGGASAVSAARSISVHAAPLPPNQPPSVALGQPQGGASFAGGTPVLIEATASDSDGRVLRVDFYADAVKIGEDSQAPYAYTWNGAAAGTYAITAVAVDDRGASTASAARVITIAVLVLPNQPPTVTLSLPMANASYVVGSPVAIEALAGDVDGSVIRVEFYAGATKLGESTQAPYAYTWNGAPVGTHAITAMAVDERGAGATSAMRSVSVVGAQGASCRVTKGRALGAR